MADAAPPPQQQPQPQNNNAGPNRAPGGVQWGLGVPVNAGPVPGGPDPFLHVRDRLFHTLFHKLTLAYARACPRPIRRIIETIVLLKSYEKERELQVRQKQQEDLSIIFAPFSYESVLEDVFGGEKQDYSENDEVGSQENRDKEYVEQEFSGNQETMESSYDETGGMNQDHFADDAAEESVIFKSLQSNTNNGSDSIISHSKADLSSELFELESEIEDVEEAMRQLRGDNFTDAEMLEHDQMASQSEMETLKEDVSDYEKIKSVVWPEDEYIVEYSLEYGFLRLSPATRQKLNITVEIVVLDPSTNSCFGDSFSQFILQGFLGYDDVLMSSIKSLAESENNKGYLRNVVTGTHYHFVSRWTNSTSYIMAALVMILFTTAISMLLRYSQHQIFVFIMDLLQMIEFNTALTPPAAPLLTVILALVGMEAIMSEFFEDTTTAFYIILIVWLADQYDSVCCHTNISKRYWLRFFYLYHLSFYCYHYRFSGQYSGLALLTMWFFTQHSMIYFFHHYEMPVVLQQAQLQDILMRNQPDGGPPPAIRIATTQRATQNNANAIGGGNNNNNNVIRQRFRGFTFGGIRFRFGVVFTNGSNNPNSIPRGAAGHAHMHHHHHHHHHHHRPRQQSSGNSEAVPPAAPTQQQPQPQPRSDPQTQPPALSEQ